LVKNSEIFRFDFTEPMSTYDRNSDRRSCSASRTLALLE